MYNGLWYIYTTFVNNEGDITKWIDINRQKCCTGMVRREDGLVFLDTLQCRGATDDEMVNARDTNRHAKLKNRYFLVGTDTFGTYYSMNGRELPIYIYNGRESPYLQHPFIG
jgi:hypothetical protein